MANSTQEALNLAIQSARDLKTEIAGLDTVISGIAKNLNTILSFDVTSFKELNKLNKETEKDTNKLTEAVNKKTVAYNKLKVKQNEITKNFQSLNAQREKAIKEIQRANRARVKEVDSIERNKNALKKQKDAVIEMSRPYNKLIAQHKQAKKVLLDLRVAKGKDNILTKKAQTEYDRLSKKVNQANGATRNFAKGGLRSSARGIRNLLGAFGLIGGVQLFASAIRNVFNRVREFDKSMQNLSGVFRTTRKELKPLEETIIDVAGASVRTTTEVAKLAETLATLGKSPEQIQKLLKPVVDLGIGLNASGAEAGEFLIQMLNAFGASDDEAMKYADTIATIRTSTTLDFQKMRDSFQYIAPISRLLNKDLAYTGAVVGILADNGLKAQQAGRVLGTSLQKLAIKGFTLTQALEQINKAQSEGVKETELLAMANSLLGAEGAKIGIVLARNTNIIEENAQAIRDNGGALDDLVNEQLKSIDAKLLVLDASWEKLIVRIDNGTGAISTFFKSGVEGATDMINALSDFNLISEIVGDEEPENLIEKIFPFASIITSSTRFGKLGAEFKAMTESFNSIDLTNIGEVNQVALDFEKAKIEAGENLDVVKLIEYYLGKLKTASTSYYESARNAHDEKMKNDLNARLGIEKDENMLKALQSRLKDLNYEQKQLGTGLTIKSSQYDSWIKLNKEISKTTSQIKELTDGGVRVKVEGLDLPDSNGIDEKTFEFTNKTRKEIEAILLVEQFRLEQLKESGEGYVDQSHYVDIIKRALKEMPDNKIIISPKNKETIDALVKKLLELENMKDIFSEVTETFADMFDIDVSKFDFLFDGLENSVEDWAKLSKELIGSVLDASLQSYEIELQQAQIARDTTLNNDLASEEAKEAAKAQFREEERRINIEKAKQERKNNLIKIAVDTAVGVVSALGDPFKIAAIIALGLTQAAIVSSQPLPKFEKGTQNSPEGMATTDEKGAEIHTDRLGNIKDLGSNKGARNKYLEKGDKIFTADQSKNMLEGFDANHLQRVIFDMNMISNGNVLSDKAVDRSLLDRMDKLASSNEKVWGEVKKLASRKINVNNKVEIKQDRAY